MSMSDEDLKRFGERANAKQIMKGGQGDGKTSLREQILAQDQYKQDIIDGLLKIRRTREPMQDEETGQVYLQEFVRLEDGSGQWLKLTDISDEKWDELKNNGMINPEGAEDIMAHINSISNNNVALSNLTESEIKDIGRNSSLALLNKLNNNRERYGIQSTDEVEEIVFSIVLPNIMSSLSKAKNGELIGEILRETKIVGSFNDDEDDDEGGGLLNFSKG